MTERQTTIFRLFTAVALAMMLVFSMASPVLAIEYAKADGETPAKAAVTKTLKMPAGTIAPDVTFTFEIKAVSVEGEAATDTNMPKIIDKDVTFSDDDRDFGSGGVKILRKETEDIFDGITFPHAGVYKYNVTEKKEDWETPKNTGYSDKMFYSSASYEVEVFVENKTGGEGTYIKYISAVMKHDDNGIDAANADKVDPTPEKPQSDGNYSGMVFTNIYLKNNGGADPKEPNHTVLEIGKKVDGTGAQQDLYFAFDVTVKSPEIGVAPGATYKAYVVQKGSSATTVVDDLKNGTFAGADSNGRYILFTAGEAQTVNLKHDQRLAFLDLPVGSSFAVTEKAIGNYKAGYSLVLDGKAAVVKNNPNTNMALEIESSYIGESTNSAVFTNTYSAVTPTGIIVDNLPFFVLIGLVMAALAGFAAARYRRNATYSE